MATIWEKAILILVGNLNSGRSYLITAVLTLFFRLWLWGHSPRPELNEASWIAEEQARMLWKPTLTNVHTQKWLWTWEIQKNMWSYWDFAKFSYTSFVLLEAAGLCVLRFYWADTGFKVYRLNRFGLNSYILSTSCLMRLTLSEF